jgi:hypothetical protein
MAAPPWLKSNRITTTREPRTPVKTVTIHSECAWKM